MIRLRNRLVIDQNGTQDVSSVLLSDEEIVEMIDAEELIHRCAGWTVDRYGHTLRCERGGLVRWIWVRSRTREDDQL